MLILAMAITTSVYTQKSLLAGILFCLALVFGALLLSAVYLMPFLKAHQVAADLVFLSSRLLLWLVLLLMYLYVIKTEAGPFLIWGNTTLTIKKSIMLVAGILLGIFCCGMLSAIIAKVFGWNMQSARFNEAVKLFIHYPYLIYFTAITAGITEELLFRGYLLPRLQLLVNNSMFSILLSSLLFGLLHFGYGTLFNMLGPFFMGIVFAFFYNKYRHMGILIIAHSLWDILAILAKTSVAPLK